MIWAPEKRSKAKVRFGWMKVLCFKENGSRHRLNNKEWKGEKSHDSFHTIWVMSKKKDEWNQYWNSFNIQSVRKGWNKWLLILLSSHKEIWNDAKSVISCIPRAQWMLRKFQKAVRRSVQERSIDLQLHTLSYLSFMASPWIYTELSLQDSASIFKSFIERLALLQSRLVATVSRLFIGLTHQVFLKVPATRLTQPEVRHRAEKGLHRARSHNIGLIRHQSLNQRHRPTHWKKWFLRPSNVKTVFAVWLTLGQMM